MSDKPELQELLERYPHLSLADERRDNGELLEFFHGIPLAHEKDAVRYYRGHDFFSLPKARGDRLLVFILRDDSNAIKGTATATFRPGMIHSERTCVGYVGDLRIALHRKLIHEWRSFFADLIRYSPHMAATGYCRHYQTALMDTNRISQINLVDHGIHNVEFEKLAGYHMLNILGKTPLIYLNPFSTWTIDNPAPGEMPEIIEILQQDHNARAFGHIWAAEHQHRMQHWPSFSLNNYLAIRDDRGNLLAATWIWNPSTAKQMKISCVPRTIRWFARASHWLPGLYLPSTPGSDEVLKVLYLGPVSFCTALSPETKLGIFRQIVRSVYEQHHHNIHMLSYCDWKNENHARALKGYITSRIPMSLYSIHSSYHERPAGHPVEGLPSPNFNMALV